MLFPYSLSLSSFSEMNWNVAPDFWTFFLHWYLGLKKEKKKDFMTSLPTQTWQWINLNWNGCACIQYHGTNCSLCKSKYKMTSSKRQKITIAWIDFQSKSVLNSEAMFSRRILVESSWMTTKIINIYCNALVNQLVCIKSFRKHDACSCFLSPVF
jgi:hypothetical protein